MSSIRISRIAAAVSLALGSTFALAQQSQDPFGQERDEVQQQEQQRSTQQSEAQPGSQEQRPEASADASQQERDSLSSESQGDLASIAEQNPDLSKFVEAVEAAGLTDALTSGTDYTIFAPTNEALESEDIDSLLEEDGNQELVALLRAHIVADDVDEEMASQIGQALTIDGGTVDISVEGESVMVGDAEATGESIQMANLRIYAVDQVLPQNPSPQTAAADTTQSERSAFGDPAADELEEDSEALPQ